MDFAVEEGCVTKAFPLSESCECIALAKSRYQSILENGSLDVDDCYGWYITRSEIVDQAYEFQHGQDNDPMPEYLVDQYNSWPEPDTMARD